jgi:hypothetical protein
MLDGRRGAGADGGVMATAANGMITAAATPA